MASEAEALSPRAAGSSVSPAFATRLRLLIGTGVVARLILAFTTHGQIYDLHSFTLVDSALRAHVFGVYHQLDDLPGPPYGRWPYPPGFFAFIVPIAGLARLSGLAFTSLIRFPSIASDAAVFAARHCSIS